MKTLLIIATTLLLISYSNGYGQLKIHSSGNVSIDTENPVSKLSVGGGGNSYAKVSIENSGTTTYSRGLNISQAKPSSSFVYGLVSSVETGQTSGFAVGGDLSGYRGSTAYTSGRTYGLNATAGNGTTGWNYAVCGKILGSNNGAAICGVIPGRSEGFIDGMYAGYFNGDVKITDDLTVNGVFTNSDINLKKDIRQLDDNLMDKLKNISCIKYKLKTPDELTQDKLLATKADSTIRIEDLYDINDEKYKKDYIGFSANELKDYFPELVQTNNDGYLGVNYMGMVPVLLQAIKEQQGDIEGLKSYTIEQQKAIETLLENNKKLTERIESLENKNL